MDKQFLLKQMQRLEKNYGREKFNGSFNSPQEMFDFWYEMFSDCNEQAFKLAVDKCIKENEFVPNIAGLVNYPSHKCNGLASTL